MNLSIAQILQRKSKVSEEHKSKVPIYSMHRTNAGHGHFHVFGNVIPDCLYYTGNIITSVPYPGIMACLQSSGLKLETMTRIRA